MYEAIPRRMRHMYREVVDKTCEVVRLLHSSRPQEPHCDRHGFWNASRNFILSKRCPEDLGGSRVVGINVEILPSVFHGYRDLRSYQI